MQPTQWPPIGGAPYIVAKAGNGRFGESFIDIANKQKIKNAQGQIDPWALIEFNFKTRDPRKVNDYLRDMFNAPVCPDGVNRAFRGGERIFLPPGSAPPPPKPPEVKRAPDPNDLADDLDLDTDDFTRLFNQYGWSIDALNSTIGLAGEFAPALEAAAEAISVGGLVFGTALSFFAFFAYLNRLDELDGILMGSLGACYQYAEWAVTPSVRLSVGAVGSPAFPDLYVKNNILHTPPGRDLPDYYQDRYRGMQAAWEAGASKIRENIRTLVFQGYQDYCQRVFAGGGEPARAQDFEDGLRIIMLRDLGLLDEPDRITQGIRVVNRMWAKVKGDVEQAANTKYYLTGLPFPSSDLNYRLD